MKIQNRLLMADGADGAGAVADVTPDAEVHDVFGAEDTASGVESKAEVAEVEKPTPTPQLSADDIAQAIKKAGIGQTQPVATPEKEYKQEDFDKAFQVFNASPELVQELLSGGDGALSAMSKLRDGLVKQAVTMASYIVQDQLEKYDLKNRPQFDSVHKYVSEKQAKELYDDFYAKNKELQPYDTVVQTAVQQLKAEGMQFKTKEEGFKAAAARTKAILKTIPGINLEPDTKISPTPTRMPTLSKGGQGGLGKGQSAEAAKDPSHSIFS